jgi:hypothetical protein
MLEGVKEKAAAFNKEMAKNVLQADRMQDQTVEDKWKEFSKAIRISAEATVGYRTAKKIKKPWITEMIIRKMDERKRWKCVNTTEGATNYR